MVGPSRAVLEELYRVGVDAARPARLSYPDLADIGRSRVRLVAVGKAAAGMAEALAPRLGPGLEEILVVLPRGAAPPDLPGAEVYQGSHPVPDESSLTAGVRLLGSTDGLGPGDTLVVALSGGASSLAVAPADGLTLGDIQATGRLLLRSGATIAETNAVRKHLSRTKGGRLAARAQPARVITLLLSDVVGDRVDVIGSGPTVPDPTTYAACLEILGRRGILDQVPHRVRRLLERGAAGLEPETPKPGELARGWVHLVGSNRLARRAVVERARAMGLHVVEVWGDGCCLEARAAQEDHPEPRAGELTGEAREVGAALAKILTSLPVPPGAAGTCLVGGGETTVTMGPSHGLGGRCQELALAAALAMEQEAVGELGLLAGGTDGRDGPTDAAGAVVDPGTGARARAKGVDPLAGLGKHDSHRVLDAAGDLLPDGHTGTNVMDLVIGLRLAPPMG